MKVPLPRRLQTRLAFKQTASFALLAGLLAWGAYVLLAHRVYDQLDSELQDRAVGVHNMLEIGAAPLAGREQAGRKVQPHFANPIEYYQLLDDKMQSLDSSPEMISLRLPVSGALRDALESGRSTWETFTPARDLRLRVLNYPVLGHEQQHYLLRLAIPLTRADEDTGRLKLYFLLAFPAVLVIHGINSWLLARRELRRLEDISSAAGQIGVKSQFPLSGSGDEIDQLSAALNAGLSRLQSSLQRMSDFLRNLSHEIRQPLTIMRAEAEQALRTELSDQNYREMLSNQLEHVQRLARTVSDLMEIAQSDNGEIKLHCQQEDLSELVQSAIDGMRLKGSEEGVRLSGTVQQNIIGNFDAGQIWRLILNLLENAIKYNRPNGRVDVMLRAHDGMALLSISDTGYGIAAEEQGRIFERGYRAYSTPQPVTGSGLGLHFARAIARAHGGDIELTSTSGLGSCFLVSLPLLVNPSQPAPQAQQAQVQ